MAEVPDYSIARIKTARQRLREKILNKELFRKRLTAGVTEKVVSIVLSGFRKTWYEDMIANREKAVRGLLSRFYGRLLDEENIAELCMYVVGWKKELERGVLFEEWDLRKNSTWAPLYVKDVERLEQKGRRYRCTIESHSGNSVGMCWALNLSGGFMQHILRDIGLAKYSTYMDEDLGGMWFTAFLQGNPTFRIKEACASSSMQTHNRQLNKDRQEGCIHAEEVYKKIPRHPSKNCFNCWKGRDECRLARHIRTYSESGTCRNEQPRQHRAPIVRDGLCLVCLNAGSF